MIHWWIRKPSRGPNNCIFWAMTEAEGEVGFQGGTSVVVPYCYLFLLSVFKLRKTGLSPPPPPPQYVLTDSSKAVLLLWFLTVTCSCYPYLNFGSAIMLVTYFVNFRLLNDHLFRKLLSMYVLSYFPFGSEGRMWNLIVSVPDHCLSFYFQKNWVRNSHIPFEYLASKGLLFKNLFNITLSRHNSVVCIYYEIFANYQPVPVPYQHIMKHSSWWTSACISLFSTDKKRVFRKKKKKKKNLEFWKYHFISEYYLLISLHVLDGECKLLVIVITGM